MKHQISKFIAQVKTWLLYFLYTQVIVTLIAFPVLVSWGLGISSMTFVGNLVFTPLLSSFLLISSLIFCTELLRLPNSFLIVALEYLTQWWHWLLSLSSRSWIVYFAKPPTWILFVIPLLTLWIMRTKKLRTTKQRLATSSCLLGTVIIFFLSWTQYLQHQERTIVFAHNFIIKNTDIGIRVIDNGFLNRKKSVEKFVEFELKPLLVGAFGTPVIDELIIQQPGSGSFATAAALCNNQYVKTIRISYFEPFESKIAWAQFFKMKTAAQENGVELRRK